MSKGIVFSPCPFCGAEIRPFIFQHKEPSHWLNGHWVLENTHDPTCPLYYNELFCGFHYGEAEDGKPTKELIEFAEKWNRRGK